MSSLLDRLRAATPADLERSAAEVLGLRPGDAFRLSRDGLTVGAETVPLEAGLPEILRVLGPDDEDGQASVPVPVPPGPPPRLRIADLEPADAP